MRLKEKLILKIKCKSVKFALFQMMIEASKCESLSDSDSFFCLWRDFSITQPELCNESLEVLMHLIQNTSLGFVCPN